uniref:BTB domain-containing protein n=1 Tax=Plectus sambesii TaxID=2011161 RepID=A0A914XL48_9BILA
MRTRKLPQHTAAVSPAAEVTTYSSDSVFDRFATDQESISYNQPDHNNAVGDDVGIASVCSSTDGTMRVLLSCRFDECERLFETEALVDEHMLDCPYRPDTWPPIESSVSRPTADVRLCRSTRKPTARYEEYAASVSKKTRLSAGMDAARKICAQSRKIANNYRRTKTSKNRWTKGRKRKQRLPSVDATTEKTSIVYLCLYCPFESTERKLYLRHRRRHALFSQHTCGLCSYAVSSAKSAAETTATLCMHYSLHFKPIREQAKESHLPPISPCADRLHVDKNAPTLPTRCTYCRRWFSDEATCRTHESHHTGFLLPIVKRPQTLEKLEIDSVANSRSSLCMGDRREECGTDESTDSSASDEWSSDEERLPIEIDHLPPTDAVLISADRRVFGVHRVVLASVSPFFRALFAGHFQEARRRCVHLKLLSTKQIRQIIRYAYTGRLRVDASTAQTVLEWATFSMIDELADQCAALLIRQLTAHNCIELYRFAEMRRLDLALAAWRMLVCRFDQVASTPAFQHLKEDELLRLLREEQLNATNDAHERRIVDAWLAHNPDRASSAVKLLTVVD